MTPDLKSVMLLDNGKKKKLAMTRASSGQKVKAASESTNILGETVHKKLTA
jgi:hypothetical protein